MSLFYRTAPTPTRQYLPEQGSTVPAPSEAVGGLNYIYNSDDAFKIAAVVACVGMRAGAFAQIPLKSYRTQSAGSVEVSPQPDLLVRPSSQQSITPSVWRTQMSISRDIWGWAAGFVTAVDGAGYPSRAEWMLPGADVVARERGHEIDWWIGGQPAEPSRILHVPSRWVLPGRPLGMAPLEKSGLVELAKQAQDFGRNWFRNGAVPSSIVYSDTKLDEKQADSLAQTIWSRWRARKPAVLGSGMKYEKISVPANESQFIETMRQAAADIAISFNLPPERINAAMGAKNEYSNVNANQQQYLLDSINPDLVVIQEVLTPYTPRGQFLRWSTGAFLRSDLKTRYESYQIGLTSGFLDKSEVRDWEELGPMPGTDGGVQ